MTVGVKCQQYRLIIFEHDDILLPWIRQPLEIGESHWNSIPPAVTRSPYTGLGLGKSLPGLLKAC
jgi:hypothetical protein